MAIITLPKAMTGSLQRKSKGTVTVGCPCNGSKISKQMAFGKPISALRRYHLTSLFIVQDILHGRSTCKGCRVASNHQDSSKPLETSSKLPSSWWRSWFRAWFPEGAVWRLAVAAHGFSNWHSTTLTSERFDATSHLWERQPVIKTVPDMPCSSYPT